MKPIELTTTQQKTKLEEFQDKYHEQIDGTMIAVMSIICVFVVQAIGVIFLRIAHIPLMNFFYNFILGFGLLTFVAFVITGIQELTENKGAKDVRK